MLHKGLCKLHAGHSTEGSLHGWVADIFLKFNTDVFANSILILVFMVHFKGGEKKVHPKRMPAVDERIVTERPPTKQTTLTHTHTIFGHGDEVISAAVSGNILLTGSKDKILRVR